MFVHLKVWGLLLQSHEERFQLYGTHLKYSKLLSWANKLQIKGETTFDRDSIQKRHGFVQWEDKVKGEDIKAIVQNNNNKKNMSQATP